MHGLPIRRAATAIGLAVIAAASGFTTPSGAKSPESGTPDFDIHPCGEIVVHTRPWKQIVDDKERAWGGDWNVEWWPRYTHARVRGASCAAAKTFARRTIADGTVPRRCLVDDNSAVSRHRSSEYFAPFHLLQCERARNWTVNVIANTLPQNVHFVG